MVEGQFRGSPYREGYMAGFLNKLRNNPYFGSTIEAEFWDNGYNKGTENNKNQFRGLYSNLNIGELNV